MLDFKTYREFVSDYLGFKPPKDMVPLIRNGQDGSMVFVDTNGNPLKPGSNVVFVSNFDPLDGFTLSENPRSITIEDYQQEVEAEANRWGPTQNYVKGYLERVQNQIENLTYEIDAAKDERSKYASWLKQSDGIIDNYYNQKKLDNAKEHLSTLETTTVPMPDQATIARMLEKAQQHDRLLAKTHQMKDDIKNWDDLPQANKDKYLAKNPKLANAEYREEAIDGHAERYKNIMDEAFKHQDELQGKTPLVVLDDVAGAVMTPGGMPLFYSEADLRAVGTIVEGGAKTATYVLGGLLINSAVNKVSGAFKASGISANYGGLAAHTFARTGSINAVPLQAGRFGLDWKMVGIDLTALTAGIGTAIQLEDPISYVHDKGFGIPWAAKKLDIGRDSLQLVGPDAKTERMIENGLLTEERAQMAEDLVGNQHVVNSHGIKIGPKGSFFEGALDIENMATSSAGDLLTSGEYMPSKGIAVGHLIGDFDTRVEDVKSRTSEAKRVENILSKRFEDYKSSMEEKLESKQTNKIGAIESGVDPQSLAIPQATGYTATIAPQ